MVEFFEMSQDKPLEELLANHSIDSKRNSWRYPRSSFKKIFLKICNLGLTPGKIPFEIAAGPSEVPE